MTDTTLMAVDIRICPYDGSAPRIVRVTKRRFPEGWGFDLTHIVLNGNVELPDHAIGEKFFVDSSQLGGMTL